MHETYLSLRLAWGFPDGSGEGVYPCPDVYLARKSSVRSSSGAVLCFLTADGDVSCCYALCSYYWRVLPWRLPLPQRRPRKCCWPGILQCRPMVHSLPTWPAISSTLAHKAANIRL